MIARAALFKEPLSRKFLESWDNPSFCFYNALPYFSQPEITDNDMVYTQFVSIDEDKNVIGYLVSKYDRETQSISGIGLINFVAIDPLSTQEQKKKSMAIFTADIRRFLKKAIHESCVSIKIGAIMGNPALPQYIRILEKSKYPFVCESYSFQNHKASNGKLYDFVTFKVFLKDQKLPSILIEASNKYIEHIHQVYSDQNTQSITLSLG